MKALPVYFIMKEIDIKKKFEYKNGELVEQKTIPIIKKTKIKEKSIKDDIPKGLSSKTK